MGWLRDSVGEDTLEIDFLECLNVSGSINLLVLPIDDQGDVGRIVSAIRRGCDMKVGVGVLREAGEEELKEGPYTFRSSWGVGDD